MVLLFSIFIMVQTSPAAGLALLFGLIIAAFRFVVTRRLALMTRHFHEAAAHGDSAWMKPVEVGGSDEVNLVAAAFNKLLQQWRDSQVSLETRVKMHTDELKKANERLQSELAERKRTEGAMREREKEAKQLAQENAMVAEIGSIINSSLQIEEVYERFAEEVRKLIPSERVSINIVDLKKKEARIAYVSGGDLAGRRNGNRIPLEGSFAGHIVHTRRPFCSKADLKEYTGEFPSLLPLERAGYRSVISVPLISKDEVIGMLHCWSATPGMYSERDLHLAARVGYQITSAIANALTFAEQKRAENALLESEQRFKDLYDHAPSGYHEYDLEGRITRVNQTEFDMLGYSLAEMMGRHVWNFSVDPEQARTEILAKLAGTLPVSADFEREYRRKDGTVFPVVIRNRLVLDETGKITGIRSTLQDITERRAAERALRGKDEFTASLLEHSPIAILVLNEDTSIRYVNPSVERLTGYSSGEILGLRAPYPWWTGDPDSGDTTEWKEHLLRGCSGVNRLFKKKNGETFWVEVTSTPINGHQEPPYALMVWLDVTERKRAAEEREKLQARLQRAQKMEAIGTLAGGVAHDLNNILSGIVSYPDLLLMQLPEKSPLRKPISTILESGKKAAAIVQDLLTLARRAVPTTEVVRLNEIISAYLQSPEHQKMLSSLTGVQVETRLEQGLLNILGSPLHLSKTIMNLISNAAEAMPSGGKVVVTTENRYIDRPCGGYEHVQEGDYVTLSVSDTGVGIAPADKERIFEPFYSKKVMGRSGTGLGMAVVWGTVKDHKGYIDIQSIVGAGSTFTLYFPVTRKEATREEKSAFLEAYKGSGESILIVDDAESQREIASALLTHLGYRVGTAANGEEAVEYVKSSKVDLVLLDMVMEPGMDGLETYKRIIKLNPRQKAVIASGFSETLRVKEAQKLGAGQYIKKPYTMERLAFALRKELNH